MRKDYADRYQKEEATHWWIKGRRDIVKALVAKEPRNARILDIGCSAGLLMSELSAMGFTDVHGIDLSRTGVALARKKGLRNARVGDGARTKFKAGSFDVIIASDILEHIPQEARALKEWARLLKPGGRAYLFVPAFQSLWSAQDEVNFHQRRYRREELGGKVRSCGLEVARSSYWNFILFFPKAAVAAFVGAVKPKQEKPLFFFGGFVNTLLSWLIAAENRLMALGVDYPVGVSLFVLAKKR